MGTAEGIQKSFSTPAIALALTNQHRQSKKSQHLGKCYAASSLSLVITSTVHKDQQMLKNSPKMALFPHMTIKWFADLLKLDHVYVTWDVQH